MNDLENFHILEYSDLTFDIIYNYSVIVSRSLPLKIPILTIFYNEVLGMLYIIDKDL